MIEKIDICRTGFIVAGIFSGVIVFVFLPEFNHGSISLLVTAFSILAGIMIAVITMLGDPANLYRGSWRMASAHRREIRRRFYLYEILFYAYLIVVGLACGAAVMDGKIFPDAARLVARMALSAGVAVFVWSLSLPRDIIRTQMARLEEEVDRRRPTGRSPNRNSDDSFDS